MHMNILKILEGTAVKKPASLCLYFNTDRYTTLINAIWRLFHCCHFTTGKQE